MTISRRFPATRAFFIGLLALIVLVLKAFHLSLDQQVFLASDGDRGPYESKVV